MANNVGSIEYDARINTKRMKGDAQEADGIASGVGKSFGKIATAAKVAAVAAGVAVAASMTKAAMASWDQVAAVEQATVGLRAYEKDGKKVNAVLEDLIKYARSDMGVLFNRKDLFQSAQMLKLNGVNTEDLSKNVQILSRSVGLGLGNWQDLNSVVGRVVATGRLSGIEFDQLTQYGFKLDKSLRNTNLSAEELFKALDKGIPVDAMEGQANTIRGLGIRMETAFRGIGDAILGVDADTSKFIKGGLGDRLLKGMASATEGLKKLKPVIASVIPLITVGLGSAFSSLGLAIGRVREFVSSLLNMFNIMFLPSLKALWASISTQLLPSMIEMATSFKRIWDAMNPALMQGLKVLGVIIGVTLLGAIWLLINGLNVLAKVVGFSAKVYAVLAGWYANIIGWIGSLIVWIARAVQATVNFAMRAREAWNSFRQAVADAVGKVIAKSMEIIDWFRDLPKKIVKAVGDLSRVLYDVGKSIIDGLINGIKDKFGDVKSTLGDLTNKLTEWKGPLSLDKVILQNNGRAVIDGFVKGLESRYGNVQSSLGGLTNSLSTEPYISPGMRSVSGVQGSQTTPKGQSVIQNNNIYNQIDMDQSLRDLAWRLNN
jgi:hypothetical protein